MWRKRRETGLAADFWGWWMTARDVVVAELDDRLTDGRAVGELLDRAERLGLDCAFAPGRVARHAVCFSCNGDPARRRQTYRLVEGAPAADAAVEFHPYRLPVGDPLAIAVDVDGVHAALADLRFGTTWDAERGLLDTVIYTPDWPQQVKTAVGFLALDLILGEDEVERCLGEINWGSEHPESSVGADGLRQVLSTLKASLPADETWRMLKGTDRDGVSALVSARNRVKPIDYPLFDELVQILIPVPPHSDGTTDLSPAQEAEADLRQRFSSDAIHVATRTYKGMRTAYVYLASDTGVGDEVEQWAHERGFGAERSLDPAWEATRPFR